MRKISYLIGLFGFLYILGIAGTHDWAEEVVAHMSEENYKSIKDSLGEYASDVEIAKAYKKWVNLHINSK